MASSILDPAALIPAVATLLPEGSKTLRSPQDGLAVLFHTIVSALAFRLVAIDETSPSQSFSSNVLPIGWNAHGPGTYTFRYKHEQSSLEFLLKVSKLGSRTLVHAIAIESDKTASLDISTNDFISPSFYPHDIAATDASPLVHGFISSNRITDLASQFQLAIIQKLIPGLRKEGYVEGASEQATGSAAQASRPTSTVDRRRTEENPPPFPSNQHDRLRIYPRNPLEIGRRDLDPFPHNPFVPPPLFPDNSADGMFVGPNHPIFGGGMRDPSSGGRGPWGGDGFLPPLGAPPGARFDPIGPGPGLGPFPGRGGVGRGLPGRGNTNDPDPDDFMPPGAGDMYM